MTKTDSDGTISYTYDANDRMLSEAGPTSIATYTYDDNGNTLSKTEGVGTTLYSYDFENRLVGVNSAAGAIAYGYDSDGIRVAKSTGAVITSYLVDKNRDYAQVLEETDNSSLTVSYVYGDDLISQNRGSSYYYLYDGQMSTRKLTDGSGNVANTYTYDAFGIVLDQAGVVANNYMYTGEQYDPNAGFYYLRARYYNQGIGRFATVDPWVGNNFEPVTLHKYLYANADPVMHRDPSGTMSLMETMQAISARAITFAFRHPTLVFRTKVILAAANIALFVADEEYRNIFLGSLGPDLAAKILASDLMFLYNTARNLAVGTFNLATYASQTGKAIRFKDPGSIRFLQKDIGSSFKGNRSITDLVNGLRSGRINPNQVEPIRIFRTTDGKMFTLDHRRLYAYQLAGKNIPTVEVSPASVADEIARKATGEGDGLSIVVRGELR